MLTAALDAAEQIFTPPFRVTFWKVIALTLASLALLWAAAEKLVVTYVHTPWPWVATLIHVVTGVGLVVGVAFLVTPVSFAVAGFFFDELADHVEAAIAGPNGRGRPMPFAPAIWVGAKFGAVSLLVNLAALALFLVPGVNVVVFFLANAYLFGRGFFELAALRYLPIDSVRALRKRHATRIFVAGCLPAALALVPIVNLLTPLFATALMIRVAQPLIRPRLSQMA